MGQIENIVLDGLGMNDMNEKMIDIIIKKAEALCPDSLALIGVYGSVITGDEYEEGSPFCRKTNIKVYFTRMFSGKITIKYILTGVICMAAGIFESYCCSFIVKTDVFKNIYCGSSEIHWAWNKLMVLMGIGYIILAGIMGIKWGLLYRITGNIWVGLGDHLLNNTVAANMLHVVSLKGADELQIVRIMAAQIISFAFVMVVYCCRNRKGNG